MENHTDDTRPDLSAQARNHGSSAKEKKLAEALKRNIARRKQAEAVRKPAAETGD